MDTVICRDIHGIEHEVKRSDLRFRPSVYGIVIRDGKVLLTPQWDGYDFPGGGMELGETIDAALAREVKEETGLDVEMGDLVHIEDCFYHSAAEEPWHSLLIYFTCKNARGELSTDGFMEDEKEYMKLAEWIPLDAVDSIKFYNAVESAFLIRKAAGMNV